MCTLNRNDVSLPSHCWTNGWQPLKNIVTNGWLTEKPSKNHWSHWLNRYHSINANGHFYKPLICGNGSKGDIKHINADSTIPCEKDVRFADHVEHLREINS